MDELELLGEETLLAPEEAEEAEAAVPWWRQEAVVPLWLAVLLVTWSLLALSDWLGAPPPTSLARAVRSRRSLSALRPARRSQQSQSQQQPPQLTPRKQPPQQQRRTAAAPDAGPATAAAAAAGRGPSQASAMAAPPQPQPQPGPSPSQAAAAAPAAAKAQAPPQIVRASPPPPPLLQTSDESLEWDEAPQPLPPASIKHVNVLLGGRLWHEASLELLRLVSEPDSSLVKNEEQARTLLSYHMKLLQKSSLLEVAS